MILFHFQIIPASCEWDLRIRIIDHKFFINVCYSNFTLPKILHSSFNSHSIFPNQMQCSEIYNL